MSYVSQRTTWEDTHAIFAPYKSLMTSDQHDNLVAWAYNFVISDRGDDSSATGKRFSKAYKASPLLATDSIRAAINGAIVSLRMKNLNTLDIAAYGQHHTKP